MLLTDHILNAPVINVAVLTIERELQRRKFFRNTPINEVIVIIHQTTGTMLDVEDCEADQKLLKNRRTARLPLVRWQLAILQLALASRNISAARDSRRILCEMRESEVLDISGEEEEVAVLMEVDGGLAGGPKSVEEVQMQDRGVDSMQGYRKRYGLFLPLPGHVGAPTKATAWHAEDVNSHVRFENSLECSPSDSF